MTEFTYNSAKNDSTGHTFFQLNCGYQPKVFFKEDDDLHSRSCSTNKLGKELRDLMGVCCQNQLYV